MLILIDHANIDLIRETLDYLPIDGVTTNPTILANEGGDPLEVLRKIHSVLPEGSQLHVQVVSHDRESMVAEGRALRAELASTCMSRFRSPMKVSPRSTCWPRKVSRSRQRASTPPCRASWLLRPVRAMLRRM